MSQTTSEPGGATPGLPGLTDLTEVGRGAYGVVYRARQERLRRFVAVKVLNARLGGENAERFTQECRALGALSGHPHIVAVYGADTMENGVPYLVMPFCERGSLAARLTDGAPLPWQETLDVGIRLAGALQTAHDAGILHRDLKPANVLVDGYGNPRLADFGQARLADSDLTGTGGVIGTPAYAAPELLSGGQATPAADVHSLAATLVALLTGRGPYSRHASENIAAVLFRVLNEPPANLREHGVPPDVAEVLEWALQKDPAQRPPSAAVFGKAMQGLQRRHDLPAAPLIIAGAPESDRTPPPVPAAPPPPVPRPAPPPFPQSGPPRPVPPPRYGPPPGAPQPPIVSPNGASRSKTPWLVGVAVVLVLALAATLFVVLREDEQPAAGPAPDPSRLLLTAQEYGIDGLRTAAPPDDGVFTQLLGKPGKPDMTGIATCLKLPVTRIRAWDSSPVYVRGTRIADWPGEPKPFVTAESAAVVLSSPKDARDFVDQWRGTDFDACQDQLLQVGIKVFAGKAGQAGRPEFDPIPDPPDLSSDARFAGKDVSLEINLLATGQPIGQYSIDLAMLSAGDSVLVTVVQHFMDEPDQDGVIDQMREKLAG